MGKWTKYCDARKNFQLTDEQRNDIESKLRSIELNKVDLKAVKKAISLDASEYGYKSVSHSKYKNVFIAKESLYIDLYKMRFALKLPVLQMADYFRMSNKNLNHKMKKVGWEYTKLESQEIAGEKSRDYGQIQKQSRVTRIKQTLDKGDLSGSVIESSIRALLNEKLGLIFNNKQSVIVGVNNRNIISPYEVDIPIMIIDKSKIYKIAVEVNGAYYHELNKDTRKQEMLTDKGWHFFIVNIYGNTKKQRQNGSIEQQIDSICNEIKDIVKNKRDVQLRMII